VKFPEGGCNDILPLAVFKFPPGEHHETVRGFPFLQLEQFRINALKQHIDVSNSKVMQNVFVPCGTAQNQVELGTIFSCMFVGYVVLEKYNRQIRAALALYALGQSLGMDVVPE